MEEIETSPCNIPKIAVQTSQKRNSDTGISWSSCEILGEILININREEATSLLNKAEYNDGCIQDSFERVHSDYLKQNF